MRIKKDSSGLRFEGQTPLVIEFNKFLDALATRGLSSATARAYAFDLLAMYRWLETTDIDIVEITQSNLLSFINHQQKRNANPHSINRQLIAIRRFYHFLTGKEIESAPGSLTIAGYYKGRGSDKNLGLHRLKNCHKLNLRVKAPRKLIEPLTTEQVCTFLRSLHRYRDIAIIHLMLLCGLRSREILLLQLDDINTVDQQIRVMGKGSIQRQLPLPPILLRSLADYLKFERPKNAEKALFVVLQGPRNGQAMSPAGLRRLFRYRRENHDVPTANAHRFRHTFGVDMARNGVRLPILQRMMGHANAVTTLGYINLSMEDIAKEYLRASKAIREKYELMADDCFEDHV